MPRDSKVAIQDILDSVGRIEKYLTGISFDDLCANQEKIDAVVRNLEIVGEAAKHIPQNVRTKCPNIPWKKIIGLRDILIHEYFGIDLTILWDIVKNKLPELKEQLETLN